MSLKRRRQLVQVARQHDALIITDDVYDQLQWPAQQPSTSSSLKHAVLPRVVDVDRELDGGTDRPGVHGFGNAVSNGSFSKIAAPGVRCGWAEGTEKIAHALSQWYDCIVNVRMALLIKTQRGIGVRWSPFADDIDVHDASTADRRTRKAHLQHPTTGMCAKVSQHDGGH